MSISPPEGNKHLLDVGCGSGMMLRRLADEGYRVAGLDGRPEGLVATNRLLADACLAQGETARLPYKDESFEGALLLDVLEHVDDVTTISEVRRILRPGGVIVITVPAMPSLWSYRDEAAGHLRRYTRRRLKSLLLEADLEPEQIRFFQFFLLPLVVGSRLLGRHGPRMRDFEDLPPAGLNWILTRVNTVEARLGQIVPWPGGSSLVAVCRRQAS